MHVHQACGKKLWCVFNCSCMSKPAWKCVHALAWDGLFWQECMDQDTATVALIDSGAMHCFVSVMLVAKFKLLV